MPVNGRNITIALCDCIRSCTLRNGAVTAEHLMLYHNRIALYARDSGRAIASKTTDLLEDLYKFALAATQPPAAMSGLPDARDITSSLYLSKCNRGFAAGTHMLSFAASQPRGRCRLSSRRVNTDVSESTVPDHTADGAVAGRPEHRYGRRIVSTHRCRDRRQLRPGHGPGRAMSARRGFPQRLRHQEHGRRRTGRRSTDLRQRRGRHVCVRCVP